MRLKSSSWFTRESIQAELRLMMSTSARSAPFMFSEAASWPAGPAIMVRGVRNSCATFEK